MGAFCCELLLGRDRAAAPFRDSERKNDSSHLAGL
jgi:hypothetical protein